MLATSLLVMNNAFAWNRDEPITGTLDFSIGINSPIGQSTDAERIPLLGTNHFVLDTTDTTLSTNSLLSLSSSATEQLIYQTRGWWGPGLGEDRFAVSGANGASTASITQRQADVATLTFAVGDAARSLILSNLDSFPNVRVENGEIRINDPVYGDKGYNSNGVAYESSEDINGDGWYNVWTLAILTEVNIDQGQTLSLTGISGEDNVWSAKITGDNGGILYSGEGVLNIKTILANGFDDTNLYTGTTTVTGENSGLTINLSKNQSFGETSNLIASNATINVLTSNAWQSVNNLELTSVTTDFSSSGLSRFTVTNTGSVATFSGQNMFVTPGAFTYTINGSAEIKDGHTAFGSNTTVQVGDSLALHSVDSLSAQNLQIGNELKFVRANGSFDQNTAAYDGDGFTVNISDQSDITYGAQDVLSGVASTVLSGSSKLTLSDQSDLGFRVDFLRDDNKKPRSQVTITSTDNLEFAEKGALALTGDGLVILSAGSSDDSTISINSNNADFSSYTGWLRLESGSMTLTNEVAQKLAAGAQNDAGLSLGTGSVLRVEGTETLALDQFGWSTASSGGILDLSGFNFDQTDGPALNLGSIAFGSNNKIHVDLSDFTQDETVRSGNIFDLDTANRGQFLVKGVALEGGSWDVTLVDGKGDPIQSTTVDVLKNVVSDKNAALANWTIDADYDDPAGEEGIYLNYSVNSLTLINGKEGVDGNMPVYDPDTDDQITLDTKAALVAKVSTDSDNQLTSALHGYGILELTSEDPARSVVRLDNNSSDYKGATVVRGNVTLNSTFGALGNSSLVLTDSSNYVLRKGSGSDPDSTVVQNLQGIVTDSGTHQIDVNDNTIAIVGNGLSADNANALTAGYRTVIAAGNVLGAGTTLIGGGTFAIGSDVQNTTGINLVAQSANVFKNYDGVVQLAGKGSTLTINGDVAVSGGHFATGKNSTGANIIFNQDVSVGENGADFEVYAGDLTLGAGKNFTINGSFDNLNGGAVLLGNNSVITLNGIGSGSFVNSVKTQANGAASTLKLIGSTVTLNGKAGNKDGIGAVSIDASSSLTLVEGMDGNGGFEEFGADRSNVDFSGAGSLALSGYTLSDSEIKLDNLSGTLVLDASLFKLSKSSTYAVTLQQGSTLSVSGEDLALGSAAGYKDLTVAAGSVLDLKGATTDNAADALFTVKSLSGSEGADLTIIVSEDQQDTDIDHKALLEQDEGWSRLLVDSVSDTGLSGGVTIENATETNDYTKEIVDGVEGTYSLGSKVANGDVSLTYALTALKLLADSRLELDAALATPDDARDLGVKLTGSGTIAINNQSHVILTNAEGSTFSGIYDVTSRSTLTLNGAASAATVKLDDSTLNLGSNQTLTLGGTNAKIRFESAGLDLTLVGANVLKNTSNLVGVNTDRIVLAEGADNTLVIQNAASAMNGFLGSWVLERESQLTLSDAGTAAVTLDRVNSAEGSKIDLTIGTYKLTDAHGTISGTIAVDQGTTLQLSEWTEDDLTFATGTASLSKAGTISLLNDSVVNVAQSQVQDFSGTWALDQSAGTQETLKVSGVLGNGSSVLLGTGDTIDFADASNDVQTITTAIDGNGFGTLKVSGGIYEVDTGTAVDVASIDVTSGASLSLKNKDQLAANLNADGTLEYESQTNEGFVFSDTTVTATTAGNGEKVLQFNLQGGSLDLGDRLDFSGFDGGKLRLISGTYVYDAEDSGYFSPQGDGVGFAVGGNGVFQLTGDQTVNMASFSWDSLPGTNGSGVLDLTGFTSNHSDPAMNVGELHVDNGGQLKLELRDWVGPISTVTSDGNILDVDSADGSLKDRIWVVKSDSVTGDAGSLTLMDGDVVIDGSDGTTTKFHASSDPSSDVIATGYWNYIAGVDSEGDEQGVYVSYGLTRIHLQNAAENITALQINGATATDKVLTAQLTGNGKVEVSDSVVFNYRAASGTDDYLKGQLTVKEGSSLQTMQSYNLGDTVFTLEDGSGYAMGDGTVSGLVETVALNANANSTVTLNGNTLELKDDSLFDATAKLEEGTQPEHAQSVLSAVGKVEFANANGTLAGYDGNLEIDQNGEMIFSGDESFTLNNLSGTGKATISTDTVISAAGEFSGTYNVTSDKTLTLNKDSAVNEGASMTLASLAVLDTSAHGGVTNIGTLTAEAGSQLNLGTIAMLGEGYASGALSLDHFQGAGDGKTVINVSVDPNSVASNDLLELDNESGKTTIVIQSAANDLQDKFDLNITSVDEGSIGLDAKTVTGVLKDGEQELGDLTYAYNLEVTSGSVGIHMKADSLALYKDAELVLTAGSNGDTTLDLALTGGLGTVILNQETGFTFARENNFGALNVGTSTNLTIQQTQTLTEGGTIEGQLRTEGDAGIVLGNNADLTITKYQSGLTGSITLGGGDSTLTLGSAGTEFGTTTQDSILAGAVLGEGKLVLNNVEGKLDQQIGSEDGNGVSLSITGDAYVVMDKSDTLDKSNLSHITVGDQTGGSALIVNATSVGIADSVDVTISQNSLLQYNVDVSTAGGVIEDAENGYQVSGNIGNLSGKGALLINLEDGEQGANAGDYELVMQAGSKTFEGTFGLLNGTFVFGSAATDRLANSDLVANASTVVAGSGSIFRLEGTQTVKDFYLASGGTLDLSAKASDTQSGTPGKSDNLLTVADGGKFEASGSGESYIRVDTGSLTAEDTLNGSIKFEGNRFASVLAAAVEENTKAPFYQIVEGDIGNVSTIVLQDENGNKITDGEYTIKLYQDNKNVADLVGGIGLVTGDDGNDLFVTQTVLGAKLHQTVVLEGDNVNIGQWLRADADNVGLTIAENSNVTLTNSTNSLTGDVNVLGGSVLNLGASNVLGGGSEESSFTSVLNVVGSVNFGEGVSQTVGDLDILESGSLNLGTNGRLNVALGNKDASALIAGKVTGAADSQILLEQGVVSVVSGADLSAMQGSWALGESAIMNFDVSADQNALEVTSGHVMGGTIAKTGSGDLTLGYDFLNDSNSAVVVSEGSLSVAGWEGKTLSLASLTVGATSFDLKGDLNLRRDTNVGSFTVAEGGTTYVGSRDDAFNDTFYDRKIDGNFTGTGGTLVFNTALGVDSSDGDSLTITGDATGDVNLLIHNTTDVTDGYQDLTILSVGGNVEGFNPTTKFDADGYAYRLGSTTSDGGTDYFLTSKADGGDSGSDGESMISARLGSLTGFAASFDMFSMSIHDRQGTRPWINPVTGEKTMTSLWLRQTATLENAGNSNGQLDSRNNEYVTMLGGDILQLNAQENGYVFAGLMAGYGTSDYETESNLSGRAGRTDTDGWMVGAYGGWHQNNPETDRTGLYVAGWVQYAHFKADISQSGEPMTVRADGISASLEAGWVVKAAEFQMQGGATQGALYIEPHAQVTWSGVDSGNLSDKNMDIYGQHNITTRLGARFTLETSGATNFSPYLEANWVHNTKDIGARWGDVTSYEEGADNQAEFKLGAETFFTDSFSGYAQIRANWGGDGYNRQEGSLGLKYRF